VFSLFFLLVLDLLLQANVTFDIPNIPINPTLNNIQLLFDLLSHYVEESLIVPLVGVRDDSLVDQVLWNVLL
jgi:hypothetical protein